MLKEIYIENLAVIEKAVIPFSDSFNVFTGETGAGKSILINGINAVLGQRVTKDIVRTGSKKAVITALFSKLGKNVCDKLDELGIAHTDGEITVTREIAADGGSVARINSRTTTVPVLRSAVRGPPTMAWPWRWSASSAPLCGTSTRCSRFPTCSRASTASTACA